MEVLIAGGGIGGLTTALFLHDRGISVRVYEAVPEIRELGVGINMLLHAVRTLSKLGLQDAVVAAGLTARSLSNSCPSHCNRKTPPALDHPYLCKIYEIGEPPS